MSLDKFLEGFDTGTGWKMMNCGMRARCKCYRSNRDIDVEFEDGTVIEHRSAGDFVRGKVFNPNVRNKYVGLVVPQPGGHTAECIACRGWDDIDIRFEDGVVIEHIIRRRFLEGIVRHPSVYSDYIGQELTTLDGRHCVCTAYRSAKDVDVVLDDGTELKGYGHGYFTGWEIVKIGQTKSIVGAVAPADCGMNAKCIADRGFYDIDIQFDDGTVVTGVTRRNFLNGAVPNPNVKLFDYPKRSHLKILGDRKMMNCGFWCTVTEYISCKDITVTFDDGTVAKHKRRDQYLEGDILHPKFGSKTTKTDSIAQRLLFYYLSRFYSNIGYCVKPETLRTRTGRCYEIDIMLWDIGVGIEFNGSVQHHFHKGIAKSKNSAIERSPEIKKLYVVSDKDKRIVVVRSPKVQNIFLDYTYPDKRLLDVFEAAKIILEDLGNDVSSLYWNPNIIAELYEKGISVCQSL